MQNEEAKLIESKSCPKRRFGFGDIPQPLLGNVFRFFSPEELQRYEKTSRQIQDMTRNDQFYRGYLRGKPDNDQSSNKVIFDNKPQYRLPEYWPCLSEDKAIAFYQNVLEAFPDDSDASSGLAYWQAIKTQSPNLAETKREDKVRTQKADAILQILEQHPQNASCFYYLGKLTEENHIKLDRNDFPAESRLSISFEDTRSTKAAALYRKALQIKNHSDARCSLARMIFEGRIVAEGEDFYGREMPKTFLEQCKALYEPVLMTNPNHQQARALKALIAEDERQKSELLQVSAKNWTEFIRNRFIIGFEQLPRQQQLALLREVILAEAKDFADHPKYISVLHKIERNQVLAGILTLGISALGVYGAFSIRNQYDLIAASLGHKGYLAIISIESILTIFAAIVGAFGSWYIAIPPRIGHELTLVDSPLRQELIAVQVEEVIYRGNFLGTREEYNALVRLEQIPNRKWPSEEKREVIDGFYTLPQSRREAIINAVREANNMDRNHPAVRRASNLGIVLPLCIIPTLVFGASSYGMYKSAQLHTEYAVGGEIFGAFVISYLLLTAYARYVHEKLIDYAEHSIQDDAIINVL